MNNVIKKSNEATQNQNHDAFESKIKALNLSSAEKKILEELMADPIAYIPDDRFRRSSVMNPIMDQNIHVDPGSSMTREEEQTAFLQLNYARYKICQLRRNLLKRSKWAHQDVQELLYWNRKQLQARSNIVSVNMGLVLAMAKRTGYTSIEFNDLISEGSFALLRATEKFDCARGFRFSTYSCRAICKSFSRAAKQAHRYRNLFPAQYDPALENTNTDEQREDTQSEWVDEVRNIMGKNLADLTGIEKSVVQLRFSLNPGHDKPLTLKEVGDKLGLTKERIRQIQNKALEKLRLIAEERMTTS